MFICQRTNKNKTNKKLFFSQVHQRLHKEIRNRLLHHSRIVSKSFTKKSKSFLFENKETSTNDEFAHTWSVIVDLLIGLRAVDELDPNIDLRFGFFKKIKREERSGKSEFEFFLKKREKKKNVTFSFSPGKFIVERIF